MRVAIYLLSGRFVLAAFSLLYEPARAKPPIEARSSRARSSWRATRGAHARQRADDGRSSLAARDHCLPAAATTATTAVAIVTRAVSTT